LGARWNCGRWRAYAHRVAHGVREGGRLLKPVAHGALLLLHVIGKIAAKGGRGQRGAGCALRKKGGGGQSGAGGELRSACVRKGSGGGGGGQACTLWVNNTKRTQRGGHSQRPAVVRAREGRVSSRRTQLQGGWQASGGTTAHVKFSTPHSRYPPRTSFPASAASAAITTSFWMPKSPKIAARVGAAVMGVTEVLVE
jgi:hypothetical protein